MSRLRYILTFISMGYSGLIQAQYTDIPDPIFEAFLIDQEFDDVIDGQVLTANINNRISLQINETDPIFPIEDLTGIQDFTSLEFLIIGVTNCTGIDFGDLNNLEILEMSLNDSLEEINITGLENLEELRTSNNNLNTLDILQNPNLRILTSSNNNLIGLDASQNPNLNFVSVANNDLVQIDIRNGANENIEFFNATGNSNLTCIFVDDAEFSTANWTDVDPTTTFVETETECEALPIDEVTTFDFSIYPNPTSQFFVIQSNQEIKQIEIVNLSGKVIKFFEGALEQYPVSDLSKGLYIISLQTDLGKSSQKLIVK